jgi:hypothetical protein
MPANKIPSLKPIPTLKILKLQYVELDDIILSPLAWTEMLHCTYKTIKPRQKSYIVCIVSGENGTDLRDLLGILNVMVVLF